MLLATAWSKLLLPCALLSALLTTVSLRAQSNDYYATVNGDAATLHLVQTGAALSGWLSDSQQRFEINGTTTKEGFSATAQEPSLGVTMQLDARRQEGGYYVVAQLRFLGTLQPAFEALFLPKGGSPARSSTGASSTTSSQSRAPSPGAPAVLSSKRLDPALVRTWREEHHYSSGYGSDFSGSTYTYLRVNADHTLSELGGAANMQGENYSGQSSGAEGSGTIPNYWVYTDGKRLMACAVVNGAVQHEQLGEYFIENGKLLITESGSGKRRLYYGE